MPYPLTVPYPVPAFRNEQRFPNFQVLQMVQNCESTCEYTKNELLNMEDLQSRQKQIKLLSDCSAICALTAKYISGQSPFAKSLAALCAQICETCGKHCLKHPDKISQACGQICLNCAKECREFAAAR
jgi:hypothetical protein